MTNNNEHENNKSKKGSLGHFLKHYGGILLLSLLCAVMTVLLIGYSVA